MTKPKQRQTTPSPANKNCTYGDLELDFIGEDSWVLVKKQKINILIPPLPVTKRPTMPNPGGSQLEREPKKTNNQSPCPAESSLQLHPVFDREKSTSLTPEKVIPTASKASQPILTSPQPPGPVHRMISGNPDNYFRCHTTLGVCSASKASKRSISFLDRGLLLNQRLRASNIERKLQRAGGLSRWLLSLGLDRFVKIFRRKKVNKFMLANLTMKKLKDMGANAVGPRRKLMHAIDCLCQPYCFEA